MHCVQCVMPTELQPLASAPRYARVLSIAGSDSGGGAGIQADLKTFAALGCFGMTAITAITAQNTTGVRAVHAVPPDILRAQIDAVFDDIGADAVKIGMLQSAELAGVVAQTMEAYHVRQLVLDPVMIATSGATLLDPAALDVLQHRLFPLALLITPNLDEASFLVRRQLSTPQEMVEAARELQARGARAVLIKGGHLAGELVQDVLVLPGGTDPLWLRAPRIATLNSHGTGCTLSSAIAAHLALGATLVEAAQAAHQFVRDALAAGAQARTGHGSGPLNHGFAPRIMRPMAP